MSRALQHGGLDRMQKVVSPSGFHLRRNEEESGDLVGLECPIGDAIASRSFALEGFGAGPACPNGQIRVFAGDLTRPIARKRYSKRVQIKNLTKTTVIPAEAKRRAGTSSRMCGTRSRIGCAVRDDTVKKVFIWKALVQALPAPKAKLTCWWAI